MSVLAHQVLVFVGHYRPAFRAGGPIKSLEHLAAHLTGEFMFSIVTGDRDIGDDTPFTQVPLSQWVSRPEGRVFYTRRDEDGFCFRRRLLKETPHDVLYLSSFFARETVFALAARRFGLIPSVPVVVAPRGEFSGGALGLKRVKKRLYLRLGSALGLFSGITWHATGEQERAAILAAFPRLFEKEGTNQVVLAPNLPESPAMSEGPPPSRGKLSGEARVAFVGRVARMKNLDVALAAVCAAKGRIHLDILGPLEDRAYWEECQRVMVKAPPNVTLAYVGQVPAEEMAQRLRGYHLMLLPTRGENFSHTIYEALASGCPVLVSDRTPWRGLEAAGAGWDIPLEEPGRFVEVLDRVTAMDQEEYDRWSAGASGLARGFSRDPKLVSASRSLFLRALGSEAQPTSRMTTEA